jgi:hypothetical protein
MVATYGQRIGKNHIVYGLVGLTPPLQINGLPTAGAAAIQPPKFTPRLESVFILACHNAGPATDTFI